MTGASRPVVTLADAAPALDAAKTAFEQVAYPGRVDLVTRELVRITSGRLSHCRLCRNLRLQAAVDRGFEEDMVAHLDDPDSSPLSQRHQAAVRFARQVLTDPSGITSDDAAALREHFGDEQLAELLLDLIRYRPGSRLTVVTGTDLADDEPVLI
jgi:alkylhydroperoxidase family enzyme